MKAIDVLGFAGSMAAGIDQAGFDVIAKREPSDFKGFGVASMTYNMPWVEAQVSEPRDWALPAEHAELVYGCPPCTAFSMLSLVNQKVHGSLYGAEAEINRHMGDFIDYAADARPEIVVMESVAPAFRAGRAWMESLWGRLRARSGLPYELTHVNMNAALVGGDVIRPRYFFVAHLQPFGIGLEFVEPRTFAEVVGDLPAGEDDDPDWGHRTLRDLWTGRTERAIAWLEEQGREWRQGTRFPDNNVGLAPPDFMIRGDGKVSERTRKIMGKDAPPVFSFWHSTDPFSTVRWRADKPFGVVVAASLTRAVHPTAPRNLTFRECARFMSLPDDWSLRVLVEQKRHAELGKAIPTASARWIGHWARMSIEGTPGEYAGRDTEIPGVRVVQVQTRKQVDEIIERPTYKGDAFWSASSDPDPANWLVDRRARPAAWWQRDDERGIFAPAVRRGSTPRAARVSTPSAPAGTPRAPAPCAATSTIERVPPEAVAALLEDLGLTRGEAARKLGVSLSRVNELTSHTRPGSWLNASRWDEVQEVLRG